MKDEGWTTGGWGGCWRSVGLTAQDELGAGVDSAAQDQCGNQRQRRPGESAEQRQWMPGQQQEQQQRQRGQQVAHRLIWSRVWPNNGSGSSIESRLADPPRPKLSVRPLTAAGSVGLGNRNRAMTTS